MGFGLRPGAGLGGGGDASSRSARDPRPGRSRRLTGATGTTMRGLAGSGRLRRAPPAGATAIRLLGAAARAFSRRQDADGEDQDQQSARESAHGRARLPPGRNGAADPLYTAEPTGRTTRKRTGKGHNRNQDFPRVSIFVAASHLRPSFSATVPVTRTSLAPAQAWPKSSATLFFSR